MKYSINLRSHADIPLLQHLPISDVIVQSDEFCRLGGINTDKLADVVQRLKQQNKKIILAWDCLVKDKEISQQSEILNHIFYDLDAIRFLDPGVGSFLQSNFPNINLEFSLEHGSLNQHAILHWGDCFLPQLSKLILSLQLPLSVIKHIRPKIPVATEVLAMGPIGIFYSRRSLLTDAMENGDQANQELTIASDDRPDQKNPILKSSKGTLVFYDKRLNIFDHHYELEDAGIDYLRFEYLYSDELEKIAKSVSKCGWMRTMTQHRMDDSTEAFLLKNPTHKLFSKLKNKHLSEMSINKSGVVSESVKSRYTLITLNQAVFLPQAVKFISPEGKTVVTKLEKLEDLKGIEYVKHVEPGVYLTSWIKFVVTGSIVEFLGEEHGH